MTDEDFMNLMAGTNVPGNPLFSTSFDNAFFPYSTASTATLPAPITPPLAFNEPMVPPVTVPAPAMDETGRLVLTSSCLKMMR
jgi:hypothetical protein